MKTRFLWGTEAKLTTVAVTIVLAAALATGALTATAKPKGGAGSTDPVCEGTLDGLDLRTATIQEIQERLSAPKSEFTSVRLVQAYMERIAAFDNKYQNESLDLTGVRMINPRVLELAAALDAERAETGPRGPLHGIPILLKDNIGTFDMPTTAGSIALGNNFPIKDAGLVAKLRDAGAIIMGKAELLEWANWGAPDNGSSVGGPQHNGYNGGSASASSSGPGVVGSMAYSSIALGSETSGSILGPTQTNSLVGLKTSHGLVSGAGVIPIAHYFDVVGPMGRNVYDVAVTLSAMAGSDPDDPFSAQADAFLPPGGDFTRFLTDDALQGVRLGYNEGDTDTMFLEALDVLRGLGAVLVPIGSKAAQNGAGFIEWAGLPNEFHYEINQYLQNEADPSLPFKTWHELMLYTSQNHPDAHGPAGASGLALASAATPGNKELTDLQGTAAVRSTREIADSMFDQHDVAAIVSRNSGFTGLGASAGYPTVMVPLGYTASNSAVGLSWFGPRFSDGRLLGFAYAYEQVTDNRIPPELYNPKHFEGICTPAPPPAAVLEADAGLPEDDATGVPVPGGAKKTNQEPTLDVARAGAVLG